MFGLSTIAIRWIGGIVLVFIILGGIYVKGRMDEHKILVAYKAEVQAAAKTQEEETKRIIKAQEQITIKAEKRHEKDITSLRAIYDRLRHSASSGSVSAAPDPTKDPAQATAYYLDVAPELATQCGETTQQLVSLQEWVIEQSQENK